METTVNKNNKLDYSGKVNIKVFDGDRLLSEKTVHNNGAAKLFNFFADCLTGNFNVAKSSRPCKIVLFKDDLHIPTRNETTHAFNPKSLNEDCRVSTKVFYDSTIFPGVAADGSANVTYHFRIPFICLEEGETVTKIGLYPNIISSYEYDLCAYYLLESGNEIEIPLEGGNFTIIIDWTLSIANKTTRQ